MDQGVEQISAENEFHDEAFIRKTFTIRLNPTYFRTGKNQEIPRSLVYSYALVFDRSPYPPPDEWKDRENGVKCSGIRDFVGVKVDSRRDSLCIGIKHHLRYVVLSRYLQIRLYRKHQVARLYLIPCIISLPLLTIRCLAQSKMEG